MLFCLLFCFALSWTLFLRKAKIEKTCLGLRQNRVGLLEQSPLNQNLELDQRTEKSLAGQLLPHILLSEEDSRAQERDVLFSHCFNNLSPQTDKCGPIFVRFDLAHPSDHCLFLLK